MRYREQGLYQWEWIAIIAILLLAFFLRIMGLTDVPPGLRYDELLNYRMAERVLVGERPIYFTESWGHEPLFHYVQAITMALTERCAWSLRLPAVFFGLFGLLTTWLTARRLLGAMIAALSTAMLAVSFWSIFFSREGSRVIALTPLPCLAIYLLWRGIERAGERQWHAWVDFAGGGIFLGIGSYVYVAARAMYLLPVVFAVYLAVLRPPKFRQAWTGILILIVIAVIVAAPLFFQLHQNPAMEQRLDQLTGPLDALKKGNPRPVLRLMIRAVGMFLWRGQEEWLYNVSGRPVFDVVTAVCFIVGVVISIKRWQQARYALLLLWLGVGLGPATIVPPAASLTHAIGAKSPAYILAALGLTSLWKMAHQRWKWKAHLLIVGVIVLHSLLSGYAYFVVWANAPQVKELYQAGITAVARELNSHEPVSALAIGAPYVDHWHPWNALAFDLTLRRDDLNVRWFNPAASWVWPAANSTIFYFPTNPLGPQTFDPALEELFASDTTRLPTSTIDFSAFHLTQPITLEDHLDIAAGTSVSWPPELSHLPPPVLPLTFGNRFALLGAELQRTEVTSGDEANVPLRLITYWKVLQAGSEPVVGFVHLTSDGRDIWGQHDGLDVRPSSLQPEDHFAQVHRVPIKPEIPPGTYHLQVGLYHPETLMRLPIASRRGQAADRVWVKELEVTN
jgi:4-amino-4-deoxy-L-arabinose transferase-like glycosyltransferase